MVLLGLIILTNSLSASKSDSWMPPPDTIPVTLTLGCGEDSLQLCANTNGLNGPLNAIFTCAFPSNGNLSISNDTCFFYKPFPGFYGMDETCIVVCDLNSCDSFYFEITVDSCTTTPPCADLPYDLLAISSKDCNNQVRVCNPFPLGEALLYDYFIEGVLYTGNLGVCTFDTVIIYSLSALPDGGQDGPYQLQSWEVNGDAFSGTFNNLDELVLLLNIFDPNGGWELDPSNSNAISYNTSTDYGQMTVIQTASNDQVILPKITASAPVGSSIYLPFGVHEVTLQHQTNSQCRDSFTAVVHCDQSRFVFDTIGIGESKTICFDPSYLTGTLDDVNFKCLHGCQNVNTVQNGDCLSYIGTVAGTDTILMQGCDQFGLCDSTFQVIRVIDYSMGPVARPDFDTTLQDTPFTLGILDNDDINGELKSINFIESPQHGVFSITTDFFITYIPDEGYCGTDFFAYEICNESGCSVATSNILISCKNALIYNGFSPNGDGKNETFTIFDIESFPENELHVYNRWGNLVYEKKNYKNEWDGRYIDNSLLPDGSYFYIFKIKSRLPMKGFVEIRR